MFTRPSKPDPLVGRIYPQHQIGEVFYLTSHEQLLWYFLMAAGVLFFFLAAAFYVFGKRLDRQVPNQSG
jgi:hypothetical protein